MDRSVVGGAAAAVVAGAALFAACGGDDTSFSTGGSTATGGSGQGGSAQGGSAQGGSAQGGSAQGGSAQGGDGGVAGGPNGGGVPTGGGGATGGMGGQGGSCTDLVVDGVNTVKPADIVFVVDNSGSMGEEIAGIESNINTNFAQVMAAGGIDYRVIMVAQHGSSSLYVCVQPPLSSTTNCNGPPGNVPNQFYHYSVNVQSHDSFCKVLNTFYGTESDQYNLAPGGWSQWLRPEALKVFIEMSDDGASCTWNGNNYNDGNSEAQGQTAAVDFDQDLLALSPLHFGSAANRNYVWYSIIGMGPKNPAMPLEPWLPTDPVTTTECTPGAVDPGTAYQWLSKGTGGLRFPICDPSGYSTIFNDIAAGVGDAVSQACEYEVPLVMGQPANPADLTLLYTPQSMGAPTTLTLVPSVSNCGADNFYVNNGLITICPTSCAAVDADVNPKVEVSIACAGP
jgi:hypothetical protein